MNWPLRVGWKILKFALAAVGALVVLLVVFVAVVLIVEMPGVNRFKRYCDYPNKDALLAAESNNVVRCIDCTVDGKSVTIVDMGWVGFLPSGAAMLVYDSDGKLIDKTSDSGDDGRFQRKWLSAWCKAEREKTIRWLRETRLPEPHLFAPSTMADFAARMEQASKDFDRPDKPKDKRGIRFECCKTAAKVVFPEKPKSEQPPVETLPVSDVSFWDALTNACERTGCTYRIYGGEVDICNCK